MNNFLQVITAISTKSDGPMGLSHEVGVNRAAFLRKHSIAPSELVIAGLVHGNTVAIVGARHGGTAIPETDALVTNEKNVFLAVTSADCLPLFYFDPVREIVAVAHAGWRGVEKAIAPKVIGVMTERLQSDPRDILVSIGPHICAAHYEVKPDVADRFLSYGTGAVISKEEKQFLDLGKVAKQQLMTAGVLAAHIETSLECTFELPDRYFSFRRDKPAKVETMLAVCGMRGI